VGDELGGARLHEVCTGSEKKRYARWVYSLSSEKLWRWANPHQGCLGASKDSWLGSRRTGREPLTGGWQVLGEGWEALPVIRPVRSGDGRTHIRAPWL